MWAVQYRRYGDPSVLQRDEVPLPTLRPGEVLIETVSSGVSDIDLMYRSGRLRMHGVGFPKQPGFDVLGVVRDTRNAAVQPGRWVWSVLGLEPSRRRGTAVEYLRVDSRRIGLFPDGCTPQAEVGALPLGALTALKSLRSARVASGQRILVVGAAGAVGTAAIQLARFFDADVDAVAGPAGLDLCRGLGATRVFDHTTASVDTARRSGSYDAVVVAAGRGKDWLDAARSGGRVVLTRADLGRDHSIRCTQLPPRPRCRRRPQRRGSDMARTTCGRGAAGTHDRQVLRHRRPRPGTQRVRTWWNRRSTAHQAPALSRPKLTPTSRPDVPRTRPSPLHAQRPRQGSPPAARAGRRL